MKNTTSLFLITAILLVGGVWLISPSEASITGNSIAAEVVTGETQRVVLRQEGYNYGDASAEEGKAISITADKSVQGCLRSVVFNIDGKKYSQYLRNENDELILPALSKGTYTFSCTMGMGFGKLIVK